MLIELTPEAAEALAFVQSTMGNWAPPPNLSVSQWASERRILSRKDSARPGRWHPEPHQPEIMDCMTDPAVGKVVLMACSQFTGKSQMMNNVIGRYVDVEPANMIVVHPTISLAEKWSKGRLDPMCEATPCLREKIPPRKARDGNQTILHRQFPGGQMFVVGANAPGDLAAQSVRFAIFDEVDRFPGSVGDEGDPIELGEQRTVDYGEFGKVWMSSTPLIQGASRIEAAYEESDKRVWLIPCPHCDEHFRVLWAHVDYTDPETGEKRPELARVKCPKCEEHLSEPQRLRAIDGGKWMRTAPFNAVAGFHIDAAGCKRANLAKLALRQMRAQGNPERMKAFANLVEARTWAPSADAPPWEDLYARRERWSPSTLPLGCCFLTAGADVQKDRIEVRVWGWSKGGECWHVETRVLVGDTNRPEVWNGLDELLDEHWVAPSGVVVQLKRMAVDSGAFTENVYDWGRRHRGDRRVMLVKGVSTQSVVLGTPAKVELRNGKRARRGAQVWPVGSNIAKGYFYGKLKLRPPVEGAAHPPGYVHLSTRCDEHELKQLTSEEERGGRDRFGRERKEWHLKSGYRNEALDCWVYAYAGAIEHGLWKIHDSDWARMADEMVPAAETSVRESAERRNDGSTAKVSLERELAPVVAATAAARPAARVNPFTGRSGGFFRR